MNLKRTLYAIVCGIGGLVLLFVVIGVFLPSTAKMERQATIDAPAATVFALIDDIRRAPEWSPWPNSDSSRHIVESVPFERVAARLRLDGEPASSILALREVDGATRVSWRVEIDFGNDLIGRYAGLALDRLRAGRLERGLANLKTLAESLPRADFSDLEIEPMVVEPIAIAYRTTTSQPSADAISEAMGGAFFDILAFMDRHGLTEAGPPLSITRTFSGSELVFDAAIPVDGVTAETPKSGNGVQLGSTYGGPVIRVKHVGSYRELSRTHEKIAAWLAAHGVERNGDAWESYVSDPTRTAEQALVTYVYYPVKRRGSGAADGSSRTSPGTAAR